MNNQQTLIEFIKAVSGQANVLTIPKIYIDIFGSHRAALLLSQSIYWSDRGFSGDGWFHKTYREWKDEIGFSRSMTETASDTLVGLDLLETKFEKIGINPNIKWYRVNMNVLVAFIEGRLRLSDRRKVAEGMQESR